MKKGTSTKFKLVVLIAVIVLLPVLAFLLRGSAAFQGITWGVNFSKLGICALEIPATASHCAASKKDTLVSLGAYDPDGNFVNSDFFAFDHYFIKWNDLNLPDLNSKLSLSSQRGRWPMVTVEPWPQDKGIHTEQNLFKDVQGGFYDPQIDNICLSIKSYQKPVFMRWGQEMEYVSGRYPWATTDAAGYVGSYRHFVTRCRSIANNTFYVWSPAGNKELVNYWPGQNYADYIGLSVFSFPQYEKDTYGRVRSFNEIFSEKYDLVRGYDRPVIVAEMGVTGDANHQWFWMQDAFRSFGRYPLLKSVVYFNAKDSKGAWGEKYDVPDWHIKQDALQLN